MAMRFHFTIRRNGAALVVATALLCACQRSAPATGAIPGAADGRATTTSTAPGATGEAASVDVDAAMATCSDIGGEDAPRLAACSAIIESVAAASDVRARALNNRGVLLSGEAQYDRAIEDYDAAIAIDAKYAAAYYNRAQAWRRKGNNIQANADSDQAIRLDPGLAGDGSSRKRIN